MKKKYPRLAYFIRSYFHQDWDIDGDTDEAVTLVFKSGEIPETVSQVIQEIEDLLLNYDENEIDNILYDFNCDYYYPASGYNGKTWLIRLHDVLKR